MAYVDLTLPEFQALFSTEEACLQAIFEARWPRGFVCPYCQHNDGYRLSSRPRTIQCVVCRRQSSITANTIFHRSHVALTVWFLAIYLIAQDKGGISSKRLKDQLPISYPTAWFLLQRVHHAMATRDDNLTLAGYIELDEAFFGGKTKSKRNRKPPSDGKKQVLVLVEAEGWQAGNLVMKVIANDHIADLMPVIESKIESDPPGQWFRSDAWGSHHIVTLFGHRIRMEHVPKHKQDEVLRCVSLAISNAKASFKGTYHNFCKKHIQRYLNVYSYRWNRRHLFKQLASHVIAACSLTAFAPYVQLIALKPAAV